MKTPEVEKLNGRPTSLREKIAQSLATLTSLEQKLKELEGGGEIVASIQKTRHAVIKSDPTFLIYPLELPTVHRDSGGPLRHLTDPSQNDEEKKEPEDLTVYEVQIYPSNGRDGSTNDLKTSNVNILEDDKIDEELQVEDLSLAENLDDLGSIYEETTEDIVNLDHLDTQEEFFDKEDDEPDEEDGILDGISFGKDLDIVKIYLKEIGQIPMQIEQHNSWGAAIFVGELALKALTQLQESPLLTLAQKEKIVRVLESQKGKFLLDCLSLRIKSVKQKLTLDKYKDKHTDEEKAKRTKQLDEEFLTMISENENLVKETLDDAKATEETDKRERLLEHFIDRQINFAQIGQSSHESFVNANLRLPVSIAKGYLGDGFDLLDLINYGNLGLMKAAASFDYRTGYQFSTYAIWWIRQAITRALADYGQTIRLPVHVYTKLNKWKSSQGRNLDEDGRPQDNMPEELEDVFRLQTVYSLDIPISPDKPLTFLETIQADEDPDLKEVIEGDSLKETVGEVLESLSEKEARILKLRFGIEDDRPRTLEEIAKEFGVTRERIRQIEAKGLRRLRHPSRTKKLRAFY